MHAIAVTANVFFTVTSFQSGYKDNLRATTRVVNRHTRVSSVGILYDRLSSGMPYRHRERVRMRAPGCRVAFVCGPSHDANGHAEARECAHVGGRAEQFGTI